MRFLTRIEVRKPFALGSFWEKLDEVEVTPSEVAACSIYENPKWIPEELAALRKATNLAQEKGFETRNPISVELINV